MGSAADISCISRSSASIARLCTGLLGLLRSSLRNKFLRFCSRAAMSTSLCGKEAGVTVAESGALAAAEVMGGLSWGLDWQKEGYIVSQSKDGPPASIGTV